MNQKNTHSPSILRFSEDPVLVVAEVGGAQPGGAVALEDNLPLPLQ